MQKIKQEQMEETLSSEYEALNLLTSGVALQQLIED